MTEPFPLHPIYDQMIHEQEERDRPAETPAAEWPPDDTTETPRV